MGGRAFWLDESHDRAHGDRYAALVEQQAEQFASAFGDIAPVEFACIAWRLATPPALEPGLVRWHRRVLRAHCRRNTWDGTLVADVRIASALPAELTRSREWWRDRGWQEWPQVFGQYVKPAESDLSRRPYLLASLRMQAPVPLDGLPPAPDGPDDQLAVSARRAVAVIARELDELLSPVLTQLEDEAGRFPSEPEPGVA
jgi:hypothetical protein